MCLSKLDKETKQGNGVGYKLVEKTDNGKYICWDCMARKGTVEYAKNRWIEDANTEDIDAFIFTYPTGFHIQLTKYRKPTYLGGDNRLNYGRMEQLAMIMVKYKNVVASGMDRGSTIVARKLINKGEVPFV